MLKKERRVLPACTAGIMTVLAIYRFQGPRSPVLGRHTRPRFLDSYINSILRRSIPLRRNLGRHSTVSSVESSEVVDKEIRPRKRRGFGPLRPRELQLPRVCLRQSSLDPEYSHCRHRGQKCKSCLHRKVATNRIGSIHWGNY